MTFGNGKTYKDVWLALGDDGTQPARVIAAQLGCSESSVRKYRQWRETQRYLEGRRRCSRCEFVEDRERPIVTPESEARLCEILGGQVARSHAGLCLWCWLTEMRVDCHAFYTSGAWQEFIDWQSEPHPMRRLRDAVFEVMHARRMTPLGLRDATGLRMRTVTALDHWSFTEFESSFSLGQEEVEALCAFAGLDAADFAELYAG